MSVIVPHLTQIYQLISSNNAVEIVAPTGTGKSTLLPLGTVLAGNRAMVATPTRISALSLAEAIRSIVPEMAGDIGTAAEREVKYDIKTTKLVFATAGHVRLRLLEHFRNGEVLKWEGPEVLFLDEVHSGTVDNSIIIGLWLEAARRGVPFPRLVLITATPLQDSQIVAQRYTIDIAPLPVQVFYTETDYNEVSVISAMVDRVSDIHARAERHEHILMFLAGKPEVDRAVEQLEKLRLQGVKIIPLYGTMERERAQEVYINPGNGVRKIVVSTNVAESSITIEGIYHVLDSMLEKRAGTSVAGGESLTTTYISHNSADQRKGRTGRTNSGTCIRFITRAKYEALQSERPLEILRVPIHRELMEILNVGLDPASIFPYIQGNKLGNTVGLLKDCGMVKVTSEGLQVTEVGTFAAKVKIGVRLAGFLWGWISQNLPPYYGVVIASIIEHDPSTFFKLPPRGQLSNMEYDAAVDKYHQDNHYNFTGNNHLHTSILLWNSLISEGTGAKLNSDPQYRARLYNWCNRYSIDFRRVHELVETITSMLGILSGIGVNAGPVTILDPQLYWMQIIAILQYYYRDRVMTINERGMLQHGKLQYMIDTRSFPYNPQYRQAENYIVPLTLERVTVNGVIRSAKMMIPLPQ